MDRASGIRPRRNLWQRVDALGRLIFPFVSTAAMLLVLATPLGLPMQPALRPALALACVFFWSLHRPASLLPVGGFLLGLLSDLLGSAPIGIGMVALLVGQMIALRWRAVLLRQDALMVWLAFAGVALLFAALVYGLDSLLAFTLLPLEPVLLQAALAIGCYPLLAIFLLFFHHGIADPDRI